MNDNLKPSRRRVFILWGALVALVALGFGVFAGVRYYRYRDDAKKLDAVNAYLDIFRNDTYGGATPEETLRLFVDALKAGDVELASKYFMPDDNGSREKWESIFRRVNERDGLAGIISIVERTSLADVFENSSAIFESRDAMGIVDVSIELVNNGKVWKIESL